MSVEFHRLTVAVEAETDDAVRISFDVPEDLQERFRHVPGQHLVLRAELDGEDVRRSYSIWSRPECGRPSVAVKRIPGGRFSTWANTELRNGDTLEVMAPIGEFGYQPSSASRGSYVALAAGSGITPVLSIIAAVLEVETDSRVTLVYGNRASSTIMFLEELEGLKNRFPERFQVVHVLSRESHEVPLFEGRVDGDKLRQLAGTLIDVPGVDAWFLCGPLDMVEDLRSCLGGLGVPESKLHSELFFDQRIERLDVPDDAGTGRLQMSFTLDGRSSVVAVDPDGPTLLDYARAVRPEVPFACKGGMCATCKAQVSHGTVRMAKNYALTEAEIQEGFVLTCQAHPVDGDVTLSFDTGTGSRS